MVHSMVVLVAPQQSCQMGKGDRPLRGAADSVFRSRAVQLLAMGWSFARSRPLLEDLDRPRSQNAGRQKATDRIDGVVRSLLHRDVQWNWVAQASTKEKERRPRFLSGSRSAHRLGGRGGGMRSGEEERERGGEREERESSDLKPTPANGKARTSRLCCQERLFFYRKRRLAPTPFNAARPAAPPPFDRRWGGRNGEGEGLAEAQPPTARGAPLRRARAPVAPARQVASGLRRGASGARGSRGACPPARSARDGRKAGQEK